MIRLSRDDLRGPGHPGDLGESLREPAGVPRPRGRRPGWVLIEFASENFRMTHEGRTTETMRTPWMLRIDPDGRVLERIVGPDVIENFPFPLPGRPVRVGESWFRRSAWSAGAMAAQGTGTYTLVSTALTPGAAPRRFVSPSKVSHDRYPRPHRTFWLGEVRGSPASMSGSSRRGGGGSIPEILRSRPTPSSPCRESHRACGLH